MISLSIFGQFSSVSNDVDNSVSNPRYTTLGDFDNDGDVDVLTVSETFLPTNYKLFLYENSDALGTFSSEELIFDDSNLFSISVVDYDGDAYLDILASLADDLVWFKNDGFGSFSGANVILSDVFSDYIEAIDLDGDNDLDLLGYDGNNVFWYEDTDGNKIFSSKNIINNNEERPTKVLATDLDGDNDLDIAVTYFFGRSVVWYENIDGQGLFSSRRDIVSLADGADNVFAYDIDGDTDKDIVFSTAAAGTYNRIAWVENLDGNGNFGSEQVIVSDPNEGFELMIDDFDNDNDYDVITGSSVPLYENNGFGSFSVLNTSLDLTSTSIINSSDLNGDNLVEIVSTAYFNDEILWYDNVPPVVLSVENYDLIDSELFVYPVPAENFVNFKLDWNENLLVDVFDISSKLVLEKQKLISNTLDISNLDSGIYFIHLIDTNKAFKIVKK